MVCERSPGSSFMELPFRHAIAVNDARARARSVKALSALEANPASVFLTVVHRHFWQLYSSTRDTSNLNGGRSLYISNYTTRKRLDEAGMEEAPVPTLVGSQFFGNNPKKTCRRGPFCKCRVARRVCSSNLLAASHGTGTVPYLYHAPRCSEGGKNLT